MTLTLLIVVNAALAVAIVVVLAFAMASLARLTGDQPAASSTAPRFGTVAADLPRAPGLTHVSHAAQPVLAPVRVGART